MSLEDRLDALERRFAEIQAEWSRPEVAGDPDMQRELGREQASLERVVTTYRRLKEVRAQLAAAHEAESDPELRELARAEIEDAEIQEPRLIEELRVLLLPRDPNDDKNVIVEIRAGTGGEEAALFAAQLFRMYNRYAERQRWQTEVLTANETGIGGLREVIFEVRGKAPTAGSSTRAACIASSACRRPSRAAASTPRRRQLRSCPRRTRSTSRSTDKDLRIDVKRSSGPGGQSVNTTDSAVRITHLPSGLVVEIQDEKSQHKNKAKGAVRPARRLLEQEQRRAHEAERVVRRSMVGSGDRSEKIRTYNFPQDRVTDHRINVDLHNLPNVLDGDLEKLLDELIQTDQAELLAHYTEDDS